MLNFVFLIIGDWKYNLDGYVIIKVEKKVCIRNFLLKIRLWSYWMNN